MQRRDIVSILVTSTLISSCAPWLDQIGNKAEYSVSEITNTIYDKPPNQSRILVSGIIVDLMPHGLAIKDTRCGDFCRDIVGITYGASEHEQRTALSLEGALADAESLHVFGKIFVKPRYVRARQTLAGKTLYRVSQLELLEVSCTKC